jgi:hypothetical protein
LQGNDLIVSDMSALAGVKLNGRLVTTAKLSSGDELLLGDVALVIQVAGAQPQIICRVVGASTEKEHEAVERQLRAFDISSYLPSISALSVAVGGIVALVWFVVPLVSGSLVAWSSGPIANGHKVIETDCLRCHASPFQPVQDKECLACHAVTEHSTRLADMVRAHPALNMRCAECHMDHNGEHGLIHNDARECIGCHASMGSLLKGPALESVASLNNHPQFRASIPVDNGKTAFKIRVDDSLNARDPSTLKLNHALHLKPGLRGKDGVVNLACSSCHQLAPDRLTLKPVQFEEHCQSCHAMEFDERLPGIEVPHQNSEVVYSFLLAEYTKLLLGKGEAEKPTAPQRILPGRGDDSGKNAVPPGLRPVYERARAAEAQLHTKTACAVCHEVTKRPMGMRSISDSEYEVSSTNDNHRWFPAARFSHGAHDAVTCDSCHEKARTSEKTSDLLLPGVAGCQECHAQGHARGHVESGCQTCHVYHESRALPAAKKQELADLVRAVGR